MGFLSIYKYGIYDDWIIEFGNRITCPSSYQARHGLTVVRLRALILYRVDVTGITASVSPLPHKKWMIQISMCHTFGYKTLSVASRSVIEYRKQTRNVVIESLPEYPNTNWTNELAVDVKHRDGGILPIEIYSITARPWIKPWNVCKLRQCHIIYLINCCSFHEGLHIFRSSHLVQMYRSNTEMSF